MDTSKTIIYYENKNGLENAIFNVQNEKWLIDFRDKLIQLNEINISSILFNSMDMDVLLFRIDQLTIKRIDGISHYVNVGENNGNPVLELYINSSNIMTIIECINDFFYDVEPRHDHITLSIEEEKDVEIEISFREREVGYICYKYAFIIKELEDICKEKLQIDERLNEILDYYMDIEYWEKNTVKHFITADTAELLNEFVIRNGSDRKLIAKLAEMGIKIIL